MKIQRREFLKRSALGLGGILVGTHLGAIAACPDCRIAFDLVPNERVNGCAGAAGDRQ